MTTRAELPSDVPEIRAVNLGAFPTALEADLVEKLRDHESWIPAFSQVVVDSDGTVAAFSLLTRARIGETPALALGPVSVLPAYQSKGLGGTVIRACLAAAKEAGEDYVVLIGHPTYYPRFGFSTALKYGITSSFEAPEEALMVMSLQGGTPPAGLIAFADPFNG